ncbi:MAG: 2-phosphosulfolactate phosphatase [Ignavibacteriaceae bacterium]|nr:2-phosphosulfolactate phosphatase [Ignavibacteriaceae bacterium]
MKVNVLLTPSNLDELSFSGKTIVIIDVLRATSTIVNALNNGAKEIIPVATVEFAVKVSGGMFGGLTLLGGERNTKKIEGFALGNSPLEYSAKLVKNKSIILYTTNGTKAVVKAKFSKNLYICSFLNLSAVAEHLNSLNMDFEILCAGRNNSFALEDTICAGKLISEIMKSKKDLELSDTAISSVALNKALGKNLAKMLAESEHGKLLLENGFEDDIKFCSKLNSINAIPYFTGNVVKLLAR